MEVIDLAGRMQSADGGPRVEKPWCRPKDLEIQKNETASWLAVYRIWFIYLSTQNC